LLPFGTSSANVCGLYNTTGTKRSFAAINHGNSGGAVTDPYFDGVAGMILAPLIVVGSNTNYTTTSQILGTLRQMKQGPRAINRLAFNDALDVEQALFINAGSSLQGVGLYLAQFV
jgi:hypothetical protein